MSAYEPSQLPGLEVPGPVFAPPAPGSLDWARLAAELNTEGVAVTPPLLSPEQCAELRELFDHPTAFRSTVTMARHRFGEGLYRYFAYPLPPLVQTCGSGCTRRWP